MEKMEDPFMNTSLGRTVAKFHAGNERDFMAAYHHDFAHMVYTPTSKNPDQEFKVSQNH